MVNYNRLVEEDLAERRAAQRGREMLHDKENKGVRPRQAEYGDNGVVKFVNVRDFEGKPVRSFDFGAVVCLQGDMVEMLARAPIRKLADENGEVLLHDGTHKHVPPVRAEFSVHGKTDCVKLMEDEYGGVVYLQGGMVETLVAGWRDRFGIHEPRDSDS